MNWAERERLFATGEWRTYSRGGLMWSVLAPDVYVWTYGDGRSWIMNRKPHWREPTPNAEPWVDGD